MKQSSLTLAGGLAALALLLGGCASDVKLDTPVPVESRTPGAAGGTGGAGPGGAGGAGGTAGSAGQSGVASVDLSKSAAAAANANLPRIVYFDFDSYVVKDEFRNVVEGNAKMLANDRSRRMSLEGHTDERGSREYNLALGQKRAEAVAKAMVLLGAAENQLEAVSFGEERPAAVGRDESAWAMNRRVELNAR
ncbi:peptidoglycan-associated lipoprotein Pal [Piscinibacter sakaiensis]|uniref:peptidoglycan-associated lipoprotein Pal n=1 Tax=Piscinibacter sakaiensis TaxID=1547922 RepID=UPI003AB0AE88